MKLPLLLALAAATAMSAQTAASSHVEDQNAATANQPPMLGIHWAKGFNPNARSAQLNAARTNRIVMTYHGGVIMPTANVHPIFWGTSWPSYSGDKITGMNSYYAGWNNSNYAHTNTEYTGSNGSAGASSTSAAAVIDSSASAGGGSTSTILNEVCKVINTGAVPLDNSGNGYYPVYTDTPRGNAGYCAWHSAGTCGGQRIEFAYFFKLDGDAGCDPADSTTGHSQGLAAIANVSGHELSEAITDPASPGAWYDASGNENGDKCAWTFGAPLVTFSNGTKWKIQGEWSNAAYNAGTGYPNSSGQKGCLAGQ